MILSRLGSMSTKIGRRDHDPREGLAVRGDNEDDNDNDNEGDNEDEIGEKYQLCHAKEE